MRRWSNQPGTALSEAVSGNRQWSQESHLLAGVVDAIQLGNWQRAGKKHSPKPKPIERPGDRKKRGTSLGADPIPISQFDDWWDSH